MSATKKPEAEPEPMLAEAKPRFSTAPNNANNPEGVELYFKLCANYK
jgi:hypothetical protein